jgi:hypothetical protein
MGNSNSIARVKREEISFDTKGSMVVKPPGLKNVYDLKAGDILTLATKNSGIVRLGKVAQVTDDGVTIDEWVWVYHGQSLVQLDGAFKRALAKKGEVLYVKHVPNVEDLKGKLQVTVNLPLLVHEPTATKIPEEPGKVLPDLDISDGFIKEEEVAEWLVKANDLIADRRGLNFGELTESLPEELRVIDVGYARIIQNYESAVFSGIRGVKVVKKGEVYMLDVPERNMPKGAGISYSVGVKKARRPYFWDYLDERYRQPNKESDNALRRRWCVSLVDNQAGNLVVDDMEVEKIEKRKSKAGEKYYRLTIVAEAEKQGSLSFVRNIVKPGEYSVCTVWCIGMAGSP